ncbi:hypothetical protein BDR26DRAFT_858398 [Obelidium mucronatum]|nr:hypothetical protein BDR26DRAFT_858398 [Obelidium mucronatum]
MRTQGKAIGCLCPICALLSQLECKQQRRQPCCEANTNFGCWCLWNPDHTPQTEKIPSISSFCLNPNVSLSRNPRPSKPKSSTRREEKSTTRRNYDDDNYVARSESRNNSRKGASSPREQRDVDYTPSRRGGNHQDNYQDDYNYSSPSKNNYPSDSKWGDQDDYDVKSTSSDVYRRDLEDHGYGGYPDEKPSWKQKAERFLCCCCPKNKKHRIICTVVILVILIAIAVPAALFWPRFPEIKVNSINLGNIDKGAFSFSTPNDNGNLNEMTIMLSLDMYVSTYNPNAYGLQVDSIDLIAKMMSNKTYLADAHKVQPLGSFGSLAAVVNQKGAIPLASKKPSGYQPSYTANIGTANISNIYFPPKSWVNYTMTFNLNYTPDPYVGILSDPTVAEIADACGITSRYVPAGRPMKIHYDAQSTISVLKPLGYAPSISNDIYINCPIKQCQFSAIVGAVQGGADAFAALQNVLSSPESC